MEIEQLKQLFAEGKTEEAKEALEEFLANQISPEEQGEALVALAYMHMEIQNAANREYIQILDYAIAKLSSLKKQKNSLSDAVNLAGVRTQLSKD